MNFLRGHGKLIGFVGLMLLGVFGILQGSIEENILALLPHAIKQQVSLFEHSPLSQKLIVITQASSAVQAQQKAHEVEQTLLQAGFIRPKVKPDGNILLQVLSALPGLFSAQIQTETEPKIAVPAISQQFARYYEELFSFQSIATTEHMTHDPFNLTDIILNGWSKIGQGVQTLNFTDGFLTSEDGTIMAGLYDTNAAVSDISAAQKLQRFFADFQSLLPKDIRVFFVGGLRYTLENALLIKRDLQVVTLAGLLCLTGVFVCFFRTKRALLVYLLPLLVLAPAAWATQLIFGHISGITLGFGSVVVGLSVDYAIYIYFALQQSQVAADTVVSKISKHLWCNFLTSGLCFVALLFSSIEVFQQIAVFALIALSLAFFIAVRVLPTYFKTPTVTVARPPIHVKEVKSLPFRLAVLASILLVGFGAWGLTHLSLNSNLNALNSTSDTFIKDKRIAEQLFPSDRGALLFALGNNREEALINNEQLSSKIPGGLPISELFVSQKTRVQNLNRWKGFWNPARVNLAQNLLQTEAQKYGFNMHAFAPFWTWLQNDSTSSGFDFALWYNPIAKISDQLYAVVNIVPNNPLYTRIADGVHSVFISTSALQKDLVQSVKKEATQVVCLALLFNFIALWLLFRSLKETLLCFVPVVLGGCFLFGCLALFQVQVNLFGLIFLPLLIGLGLDYAIFQLMKYRSKQEDLAPLYSTRALLAAGLSTLAGFGVLVLAKHAVLFMMGVCALVGIGGTVLVSLFILPALWKRSL